MRAPASLASMTSDTTPTQAAKKTTAPLWAGLAVAALCAGAGLYAALKPDAGDGYDARAACREFVKRELKAPATAKFSDLQHVGSGTTWTVTGAVDAENGFGATVRMTFTCRVRLDGESWKLETLTGLR